MIKIKSGYWNRERRTCLERVVREVLSKIVTFEKSLEEMHSWEKSTPDGDNGQWKNWEVDLSVVCVKTVRRLMWLLQHDGGRSRSSDERGKEGQVPQGLLAMGSTLTWAPGGFLQWEAPFFFRGPDDTMIVEELLVYPQENHRPSEDECAFPWIPHSQGNPHYCSQWTSMSVDDTLKRDRTRTLMVWVRSHSVLQRQRGTR